MGLIERLRREEKSEERADPNEQRAEREAHPPREERRPLSEEERDRLIEETRSDLPDLDRKVEENVDRLRELSKS